MIMTAEEIAKRSGWICVHAIRGGSRAYAGEALALACAAHGLTHEQGFAFDPESPESSHVEGEALVLIDDVVGGYPASHGTRFVVSHGERTRIVQIEAE